jgi:hypothetical protein
VGFLATCDDIRAFLKSDYNAEVTASIAARLKEYVNKYSVYREIVILDTHGNVRVNLNPESTLSKSSDQIVKAALNSYEPYLEVFGKSDLEPKYDSSLIYACKITDQDNRTVLGVLCLCFKFEDEMERIFKQITNDSTRLITIMDSKSKVIASSNHSIIPIGTTLKPFMSQDAGQYKYRARDYLAHSSTTKGYQGFNGLEWYSHIMIDVKSAFSTQSQKTIEFNRKLLDNSTVFSDELKEIKAQAEEINDNLQLVILNGELIASKQKAYQLSPVLDNTRIISESINAVFQESIHSLHQTIISGMLADTEILALMAVDIMDRNLYERANDCRWWALTSFFRSTLTSDTPDVDKITNIITYINSLYTVYTNIFIFDAKKKIIAVSNRNESSKIGLLVNETEASRVLSNSNSQNYVVSKFEPTNLYDNKHAYIYYASICDLDNANKTVGGVGIVFDSEPQFKAMLEDSLPKDEAGAVKKGAFGLFTDKEGNVVSSTDSKFAVGSLFKDGIALMPASGEFSGFIEMFGMYYVVACAKSPGYREYKTTDGYKNDIYSFIFEPLCEIKAN